MICWMPTLRLSLSLGEIRFSPLLLTRLDALRTPKSQTVSLQRVVGQSILVDPVDGHRTAWDRSVYRPLRPPTPPIPPDSVPDTSAVQRAFSAGLTYTVFSTFYRKRIMPRHAGQHLLELVETALSLTPEIRRPLGHRVQLVEWPDMPSPQIVIWGGGSYP